MKKDSVQLEVTVDMTEIDEKATQLVKLLKEANSLADELASKEINIFIHMKRWVLNQLHYDKKDNDFFQVSQKWMHDNVGIQHHNDENKFAVQHWNKLLFLNPWKNDSCQICWINYSFLTYEILLSIRFSNVLIEWYYKNIYMSIYGTKICSVQQYIVLKTQNSAFCT